MTLHAPQYIFVLLQPRTFCVVAYVSHFVPILGVLWQTSAVAHH